MHTYACDKKAQKDKEKICKCKGKRSRKLNQKTKYYIRALVEEAGNHYRQNSYWSDKKKLKL